MHTHTWPGTICTMPQIDINMAQVHTWTLSTYVEFNLLIPYACTNVCS